MLRRLVPTLCIWGGMAISGLVIPGQIVPSLVLGFLVGFLTLHLSLMFGKPEAEPVSSRSHVRIPQGGARFIFGVAICTLGGAAFGFWTLWRGWASLEGHIVLASTSVYVVATAVGLALGLAVNVRKMTAA